MSNQTNQHKAECLVIGGLFAAGFGLCVYASSAAHWLAGFSAWGVGEALRSRRKLEYVQVFRGSVDYLKDSLGEVSEVALPFSRAIDHQRTQLAVNALKQLPMGDRLADQFIARQGLTTDWFNGIEKRSGAVCGESQDGKSFLLQWRVMRFLQGNPEGEILVCDPDYGSSHEGSEPNTWFNLPVGPVVQIDAGDITNAIFYVSDEVSDRARRTAEAAKAGKAKPQFRPLLLVCDEWGSYWDSLDERTQENVIAALRNICNRGIKQGGVTFILGLHDLSVRSTGIPQALMRKLETILLWRASQSKRNYDNLDIPDGKVEAVVSRMSALPRTVRDRRPCVVWSDKALEVRALPHLELTEVEFVAPEPIDHDQQWLDRVWTPEFENALLMRMAQRLQDKKTKNRPANLTEFWRMTGESQNTQLLTNPRYALFRDRVENLEARFLGSDKTGRRKCLQTDENPEVSDTEGIQATDEKTLPSENGPSEV